MSNAYRFKNPNGIYFVTFTVVDWIDVFTRPIYKEIIIDSLNFSIKKKGLIIHAWVIMSNHIHLIISAEENHNLSDIVRDFKKFTSKRIIDEIISNPTESRKNWMLWIFKSHGEANSNNKNYQFWSQDYHGVELDTNRMKEVRLSYIHNNPVKAQLVFEPEHYFYSSAADYSEIGNKLIDIVLIE